MRTRELDIIVPNRYGIYKADTNTPYNNTEYQVYVLYPHNIRMRMDKYNGKLYVPFIYRGRQVILKGDRLYPI